MYERILNGIQNVKECFGIIPSTIYITTECLERCKEVDFNRLHLEVIIDDSTPNDFIIM